MARSKVAVSKTIGIDLGTSNSAAAMIFDGRPTIIPSAEGLAAHGKMFTSVVAFTDDGLLVGELAKERATANPERTIISIKRKMGTDYRVKIDGKEYTPQEISAMILRKIKYDAEAYLGEKIERAVITVPAYFNDNQRTATKDAGIIAGLEVLRLVNEPTAASLAYGLDKVRKELKIAVLDLGGGTFDVTIMEMSKGVFEVISTSGDTQLGGTDMDDRIVYHLANEFQKKHDIDLREYKKAMARLREAAEKAKIDLSTMPSTRIHLPFITGDLSNPKHLGTILTRAKLETLIEDVIARLDGPMECALKDAGLEPKDVDRVILVGGPTKMPVVQRKFKKFFGKEFEKGIDPMECVAKGAAIQGGILAGEIDDIVLLDVTPLSLGIETSGCVFTKLIERNTKIPVTESEIFSTAKDLQTTMAIHVLQGERPMAADNITLGLFNLTGIPPAPRREPMIEVTFDIDADGILSVSAEDLDTGKKQKVTIESTTKLSEEEMDRMIKDAERFATMDKKIEERVKVRNRADALIHATEAAIKDVKISKDEKERIESAIEKLREVLKDDDVDRIRKDAEELDKIISEIGARV